MLSRDSLNALAREIGPGGLVLSMYLNIPTTRLVNIHLAGLEKGQGEDVMTMEMLMLWKELRATAKEKDKVHDLERALKEAGKLDHADIVMDKYQNESEMTADCFPAS